MQRVVLTLVLLIVAGRCAGESSAESAQLTPVQALRELRLLKSALVTLHPGLYRYQSPQQFDAAFTDAERTVSHGASVATMYLLVSHLAAAVRCGHTWTNPLNQADNVQHLFLAADKLPLRLQVVDDRFLITASSNAQLRAGDELLAIDGRTAAELIAELLPYLRADGSNDGKRLSQLDSGINGGAMDRLFPLLHPPTNGHYSLLSRRAHALPSVVSVPAVSAAQREAGLTAAGLPEAGEAWTFHIEGRIALLTIPTFAFWHADFDWKGFLIDAFTEINRRGITRLILDLRRNEGGDSAVGDELLSHLLHSPYTAAASHAEVSFERAPYALAHYLDTWDFDFFDHTGHVQPTGGRNLILIGFADGGQTIEPSRLHFRGSAVALIGPQMSSAGFIIARDLQRSQAAILVGQPAGGSLKAMDGGQLAWLTLPVSGTAVDIPLIAWVPDTAQPDQTVFPDIAVTRHFESAAAGVDAEEQAARQWLSATRAARNRRWLADPSPGR